MPRVSRRPRPRRGAQRGPRAARFQGSGALPQHESSPGEHGRSRPAGGDPRRAGTDCRAMRAVLPLPPRTRARRRVASPTVSRSSRLGLFHAIPCMIVRDETEWVELAEAGRNRLCPPVDAGRWRSGLWTKPAASVPQSALRQGQGCVGDRRPARCECNVRLNRRHSEARGKLRVFSASSPTRCSINGNFGSRARHARERGSNSSGIILFPSEGYSAQEAEFHIERLLRQVRVSGTPRALGHSRPITNGLGDNRPVTRRDLRVQ